LVTLSSGDEDGLRGYKQPLSVLMRFMVVISHWDWILCCACSKGGNLPSVG